MDKSRSASRRRRVTMRIASAAKKTGTTFGVVKATKMQPGTSAGISSHSTTLPPMIFVVSGASERSSAQSIAYEKGAKSVS